MVSVTRLVLVPSTSCARVEDRTAEWERVSQTLYVPVPVELLGEQRVRECDPEKDGVTEHLESGHDRNLLASDTISSVKRMVGFMQIVTHPFQFL